MPLKLIPPGHGAGQSRSAFYYIRGTHLGVRVFRSTGLSDRRKAQRVLDQLRQQIEDGQFTRDKGVSFSEAAITYIQAGRETRFLKALIEHFKEVPISEITQAAIDRAAAELYPDKSAATRNRAVYTPVSAVLKHAGVEFAVKRPKGHAGKARTHSLTPKQATALYDAAPDRIKPVFRFLLYTGCRLSEALNLEWHDIDLDHATALARETKNGDPRIVHLTAEIVADLRALPRDRKRVFGWAKSGRFYAEWGKMTERANLAWASPHVCRHTYATWMRRYAGRDLKGLVATGAWKDLKSVARYAHAVPAEESRAADLLPKVEHAPPIDGISVDPGPEAA